MTEEIINKDELKNLRFLLQNGQKLAISTKEFERVFDKIDSLEQENKENIHYLACMTEQRNKLKSALEKIRDLCIHYENTNDKCVINCYAHFIVTDLIQNKINEVLQ
jgi:hypothetical protein